MIINKIHNMDCLEGLKKCQDDSVDLILTDPPYFLPINSYVGKRGEGYHKRTLADTSILKGYFERIFEQLDRVLKPTGSYYVFCDAQSYPIFYQVMFPYCNHVRLIIWDKKVSYNGYTWRHQHELIAWGEKKDSPRIPTGDGDIIKCRGVLQKDRNHPAEKPTEILKRIIKKHKESDDMLVLDPYMGSGSVAVACKQSKVRFLGFELNKDYVDISNRRIEECRPLYTYKKTVGDFEKNIVSKNNNFASQPSNEGDIIIAKSNKIPLRNFTSDSTSRTFANAKGI